MKALLIGGTGVISKAISRKLLLDGEDLWLINRGNRLEGLPEGAHLIQADINDEAHVAELLGDQTFDVVPDFKAVVRVVPLIMSCHIRSVRFRIRSLTPGVTRDRSAGGSAGEDEMSLICRKPQAYEKLFMKFRKCMRKY